MRGSLSLFAVLVPLMVGRILFTIPDGITGKGHVHNVYFFQVDVWSPSFFSYVSAAPIFCGHQWRRGADLWPTLPPHSHDFNHKTSWVVCFWRGARGPTRCILFLPAGGCRQADDDCRLCLCVILFWLRLRWCFCCFLHGFRCFFSFVWKAVL